MSHEERLKDSTSSNIGVAKDKSFASKEVDATTNGKGRGQGRGQSFSRVRVMRGISQVIGRVSSRGGDK